MSDFFNFLIFFEKLCIMCSVGTNECLQKSEKIMNVKTKLNKIENIYGIDIYKLVKEINKYIRNTYHTKKIYVELDESDTTLNLMNDKTMKYYTLKY